MKNSRLPELASGHGPWLLSSPHTSQSSKGSQEPPLISDLKIEPKNCCTSCCICKQPLPAALDKWVQGPWAPQTCKGVGWDQDCSPINKSFNRHGMLRCLRGTWIHAACFCTNLPECTNLVVFSQQQAKKTQSSHISYREGWKQNPGAQHPPLLDESPEIVTCLGTACAAHIGNLVLKNQDSDSGISSGISPFQGHLLGKQYPTGNLREIK